MAPDINSLPTSPRLSLDRPLPSRTPSNSALHSTAASRSRPTSQVMGPPTVPVAGERERHGIPHRLSASSVLVNSSTVGEGGVPLRHPRPLTAAELYAECEKEQEAVVNRLTRELTALRAQSASVASNASHSSTSTSASLLPVDISDPNPTHQMTGATHPTPSRRHRSSSSLSARSIPAPSPSIHPNNSSHPSHASYDRASAAAGGSNSASLSRRPSINAHSGASTPARQSLDIQRNPASNSITGGTGTFHTLPHRPSLSRDPSYASSSAAQAGTPQLSYQAPHPPPSPNVQVALQHHADTTLHKSELEIVKSENEALRQRVRALERALRSQPPAPHQHSESSLESPSYRSDAGGRFARDRDAQATSPGIAAWAAGDGGVGGVAGPRRDRSESQSTSASASGRRNGGNGGAGEEVRVGESAGSVGIGRGN